MLASVLAALMDGQIAEIFHSPFVVPVAGCFMILGISATSIWSGVRTREIQSHERLARIAQGLPPESEWEGNAKRTVTDSVPATGSPARPNDGAGARRAGIILLSIGCGLIGFFFVLALAVHTPEVLSGSAAGIIPLAIGLGFLTDARMRRRDFDRWMDTVYPRMASYPQAQFAETLGQVPPPPPPAAPAGMTPAQASDWRPLH